MNQSITASLEPTVTLPAAGGTSHLLIVDDSPAYLAVLAAAARASGQFSSVTTVEGGRFALAWLRRCAATDAARLPHAIVTDLYMPGFSGAELLAEMRISGAFAGMRRVVMSEWDSPVERNAAHYAGCDSFVRKPGLAGPFEVILRAALTEAPVPTEKVAHP